MTEEKKSPAQEPAAGPVRNAEQGDGAAARSACGGARNAAERTNETEGTAGASERTAGPAAGAEPESRPHGTPAGGTVRQPDDADRLRAGKSRFPTLVDLLVFLGIFFVANLLGSVAALLAGCPWPDTAAADSADEAVRLAAQTALAKFNAITYFVMSVLTLGGYLLYRARRGGPRTIGSFSLRGLDPVLLLWGVLLIFSMSVVLEPLLGLLPEIPNVYGRGVWSMVTLVVMAPLFEEVIFRGVLLESLRARYGVLAAWLVSSLLFGLVHLHPAVVVNAVFAGLVLGFVYLASRSLWSSIFLHAVNNGISYVMLAMGLGSTMLIDIVGNRTLYVVIYIAAAAVFILSGCMMLRALRRMKAEEKKRAGA